MCIFFCISHCCEIVNSSLTYKLDFPKRFPSLNSDRYHINHQMKCEKPFSHRNDSSKKMKKKKQRKVKTVFQLLIAQQLQFWCARPNLFWAYISVEIRLTYNTQQYIVFSVQSVFQLKLCAHCTCTILLIHVIYKFILQLIILTYRRKSLRKLFDTLANASQIELLDISFVVEQQMLLSKM